MAEIFIAVGENIHCTRIYKVGGKFVKEVEGVQVIAYRDGDNDCRLPIPDHFIKSSEWDQGKVRHTAVAIWQAHYGDGAGQEAGKAYINYMARRQEAHGATFLDLNVDEFSTETDERAKVMQWVAGTVQAASSLPLSIDSSNTDILKVGLEACDKSRSKAMVNSVSLERQEAIALAADAGAAVIAGATGESSLPNDKEERIANIDRLVEKLDSSGISAGDIYLDPLVFPVSVNPNNGVMILEAVKELRAKFGTDIHFAPGLSNISFGMPNRKLLNQVFTYLCVEQGLDGGIVDPLQINNQALKGLDTGSDAFSLARSFLMGEDQYGMNFIGAVRSGKL